MTKKPCIYCQEPAEAHSFAHCHTRNGGPVWNVHICDDCHANHREEVLDACQDGFADFDNVNVLTVGEAVNRVASKLNVTECDFA